jgi:hypothetical protein
MTKFADILDVLQEAVNGGVGLPDAERLDLYKRSFAQAGEALAKAVVVALPDPGGTDHVSLMLAHLQGAENAVRAIEAGATLDIGGARASGEALQLAKAWLDLGEIAIVALASENAAPLGEGETAAEGLSLAKVAVEGGEVLVKTSLPEGLQGLIAPPAAIAQELVGLGAALIEMGGGDLAKFYPRDDEDDEDDGGGEGEMGGDEAVASALEDLAKLGQMAVLQVAAIKEQLGDDVDFGAGEAGELSALDAIAAHGAFMTQQADMLMRAAGGELEEPEEPEPEDRDPEDRDPQELERSAKADGLTKQQGQAQQMEDPRVAALQADLAKANTAVAEMSERLSKLEAQPADPKGVLRAGGIALTKQADNGGGEVPASIDDMAAELHKLDPAERTKVLMKMALSTPIGVVGQHSAA